MAGQAGKEGQLSPGVVPLSQGDLEQNDHPTPAVRAPGRKGQRPPRWAGAVQASPR